MIRRCPRYPECLVATTIDERRYCPQHGAPLMPMEQACSDCGYTMLPEDRFCSGCGAAAESTAVRVLAPPSPAAPEDRDATPNEETCLVVDWMFKRPGILPRLTDAVVVAGARAPAEIRHALRRFVTRALGGGRYATALGLHPRVIGLILDRIDWDHLTAEYCAWERRTHAEDRAEAQGEDRS